MYDILQWFWTGAVIVVLLWWVIMMLLVCIVGPVEMARMIRNLNQSSDDEVHCENQSE